MRIALLTVIVLTWSVSTPAAGRQPSWIQVQEQIVIHAPVTAVWDLLGNFADCQLWHPRISQCPAQGGALPGATRSLTLKNGAHIGEKLIMYNRRKRELMYRITDMSQVRVRRAGAQPYAVPALPVRRYHAWLRLTSLPDGSSQVSWKARFLPAHEGKGKAPPELDELAAKSQVRAFIKAGLAGLKRRFEP